MSAVISMPRPKKLRRPTASELRRFRAGLSEYEAQELLLFMGTGWDVVVAKWLIQNFPRSVMQIDVESWAQGYGFDALLPRMQREVDVGEALVSVDLAHALSDEIDLDVPVIVGRVILSGNTVSFLIDGHHRLIKAYSLYLPTLPAFLLSEEETEFCRITIKE